MNLDDYIHIREKITDLCTNIIDWGVKNKLMAFNHYAKKLDLWDEEEKCPSLNDRVETDCLSDLNLCEARFEGKTLASEYLRKSGAMLNEEEKEIIEAIENSHYSYFEIIRTSPNDYTIELKDILDYKGKTYNIINKRLAETAVLGCIYVGRLSYLKKHKLYVSIANPILFNANCLSILKSRLALQRLKGKKLENVDLCRVALKYRPFSDLIVINQDLS